MQRLWMSVECAAFALVPLTGRHWLYTLLCDVDCRSVGKCACVRGFAGGLRAGACKPMEYRFVSITRYAEMVGISREAVYKRIASGSAVLLEICEVPVVDLSRSKGTMTRNEWPEIVQSDVPKWAR